MMLAMTTMTKVKRRNQETKSQEVIKVQKSYNYIWPKLFLNHSKKHFLLKDKMSGRRFDFWMIKTLKRSVLHFIASRRKIILFLFKKRSGNGREWLKPINQVRFFLKSSVVDLFKATLDEYEVSEERARAVIDAFSKNPNENEYAN